MLAILVMLSGSDPTGPRPSQSYPLYGEAGLDHLSGGYNWKC